jgi:hypothetical protein
MAAQQPKSFLWIDKDLRSQSLSNCKKDAAGRGAIYLHIEAWRSEARRLPSKVIIERFKDSGGCKCREGAESPQAYGECMCRCARATSLGHSETSDYTSQCRPCGSPSDPFGCSKGPVDEEIHRALTFFSVVWIITAFISDVSRDASAWSRASRSESVASDLVL